MNHPNLTQLPGYDKLKKCSRFSVSSLVFSLLILALTTISCDLFTKPKDPNYLKKIDEEIAWANAAKLTVTVAYPDEWGSSPQFAGCFDAVRTKEKPRKGYPFNVEFTPNAMYGFIEWLAFGGEHTLAEITAMGYDAAAEISLNGKGVAVTEAATTNTGAKASAVTVNSISGAVTLVPFCDTRPRIILSDPPLVNAGLTYGRAKDVKIHFSIKLQYNDGDAIPFDNDENEIDEDENGSLIHISGQASGSNAESWTNPQGSFETPVYVFDPVRGYNYLHIKPKPEPLMPPENAVISITVGTGIKAGNGQRMAAPVTIIYATNAEKITKAYKADNVWAIHDLDDVQDESDAANLFFYRALDKIGTDRRLRNRNANGEYQVTLYFTVSRSHPEEMPDPEPDSLIISEIPFMDLAGDELVMREKAQYIVRPVSIHRIPDNPSHPADRYYRSVNSRESYCYKAVYTWDDERGEPVPGIIRLAIRPWRSGGSAVDADAWETVISEGRFEAVVFDNRAPEGEGISLGLGGSRNVTGGVHNYDSEYEELSMQPDFSGVRDNNNVGIPLGRASLNKPWTMDEQAAIEWQYRIATGSTINKPPSAWLTFSEKPDPIDLSGLGLGNVNAERQIQVRFRDSLGNGDTDPEEGWKTIERFVYFTEAVGELPSWDVSYNMGGSSFSLSWTSAADIQGVEYSLNNGELWTATGTSPYILPDNIPPVSYTGIREGVSNKATMYSIRLRAYNGNARQQNPPELQIWNIEGMKVTSTRKAPGVYTSDLIVIGNSPADIAKLSDTANLGARFALAEDIVLGGSGGWMPAGNSEYPFTGTFYGNGFTVTIKSFAADLPADMGLFGVAEDAVIRDLEVVYPDISIPPGFTQENVGGIAGRVTGNTGLLNCIVRSENTEDVFKCSAFSPGTAYSRLGGLAGLIEGTSYIQNCRAALNVTLSATSTNHMYVGGVIGLSASTGTFANINSVATISMHRESGSGSSFCGGIAGDISLSNLFDCIFNGKIDIPNWSSTTWDAIVGGLVGRYYTKGKAEYCYTSGDIIIHSSGSSPFYLGGVVGNISRAAMDDSEENFVEINNSGYSNGVIALYGSDAPTNTTVFYVGGFVGRITRNGIVKNCYSSAGSVISRVTGNGSLVIGGFAGAFSQVDISDCSSSSLVIVPAEHATTGFLYAGGFSGLIMSESDITSKLERCFATGSISVHCRNNSSLSQGNWIGGLVGRTYLYTVNSEAVNVISQCYATGNVVAVNHSTSSSLLFGAGGLVGLAHGVEISESYATGSVSVRKGSGGVTPVIAGGLVGYSLLSSSITDCYALGNVIADNPNTANASVYAGGLAGYVQITADTRPVDPDPDLYSANAGYIQRSFAGGSVTAQNTSSGAGVWAGGVAGYIVSGELRDTAATGRNRGGGRSSVSAQGGNTSRFAGRVFGEYEGAVPANNWANMAIFTGTDSSYYAYPPLFTTVVTSTDLSGIHGADRTNALFSDSLFWTTALLFNSSTNGGNTSAWDFGSVSQGWPVLANVGGEQ